MNLKNLSAFQLTKKLERAYAQEEVRSPLKEYGAMSKNV